MRGTRMGTRTKDGDILAAANLCNYCDINTVQETGYINSLIRMVCDVMMKSVAKSDYELKPKREETTEAIITENYCRKFRF